MYEIVIDSASIQLQASLLFEMVIFQIHLHEYHESWVKVALCFFLERNEPEIRLGQQLGNTTQHK